MDEIGHGRTGIVYQLREGFVVKSPWSPTSERYRDEIDNAFVVERKLLERLGDHPRVVRYHGPYTDKGIKNGLLLGEANCGDLQSYINNKDNNEIDNTLRRKWSLQIAEAVAYIHEKGIIHSNLSTANALVHQDDQSIDLVLADFGGSNCHDLGLSGYLLPDEPYFDYCLTNFESSKLNIYSLGIIIYIINTGHYPFYKRPAPQNEEILKYEDSVRSRLKRGEFPSLSGVLFGDIIAGCCIERRYDTAKEVVIALEAEMRS